MQHKKNCVVCLGLFVFFATLECPFVLDCCLLLFTNVIEQLYAELIARLQSHLSNDEKENFFFLNHIIANQFFRR